MGMKALVSKDWCIGMIRALDNGQQTETLVDVVQVEGAPHAELRSTIINGKVCATSGAQDGQTTAEPAAPDAADTGADAEGDGSGDALPEIFEAPELLGFLVERLNEIAAQRGIEVDGLNKPELVNAILAKQAEAQESPASDAQ